MTLSAGCSALSSLWQRAGFRTVAEDDDLWRRKLGARHPERLGCSRRADGSIRARPPSARELQALLLHVRQHGCSRVHGGWARPHDNRASGVMAPRSRPYVRRTPGLTALSARSPPDRPIVATQIVDATDFVDSTQATRTSHGRRDRRDRGVRLRRPLTLQGDARQDGATRSRGARRRPRLASPRAHLSRRGHPTHARHAPTGARAARRWLPSADARPADYTSLGSVSPPARWGWLEGSSAGSGRPTLPTLTARRIFSWQRPIKMRSARGGGRTRTPSLTPSLTPSQPHP